MLKKKLVFVCITQAHTQRERGGVREGERRGRVLTLEEQSQVFMIQKKTKEGLILSSIYIMYLAIDLTEL